MAGCRSKQSCPLDNKCLVESIIYKATVITDDGIQKEYIGNTGNTFKQRYTAHKASLNDENKKHSTKLSTYVWSVQNKQPKIEWQVIKKVQPYTPSTRKCNLCNHEKLEILKNKGPQTLNSRNELASKCPHSRPHKLKMVKKPARPPEAKHRKRKRHLEEMQA